MIFDYIKKLWREHRSTKDGVALIDASHAAFYDGREFRTQFDFSLTNGQTAVLKVVLAVNTALHLQSFSLDEGELLFEAAILGTEGGTFGTALPIFGTNRTDERPQLAAGGYYAAVNTITTGGTHTGGTVTERVRLNASQSPAQRNTVGNTVNDSRLLPPGIYYLRFTGTGTITRGIYTLREEERPTVNPFV